MTTELVDATLEMYRTVTGNKDCTLAEVCKEFSSKAAREPLFFGGNNMGGKMSSSPPPEIEPLNMAENDKQ